MIETTVAAPSKPSSPAQREAMQSRERYSAPPVDIYKNENGLVVVADLPGVSKDGLDVGVENDFLSIRGVSRDGLPGNAIYSEFELVHYFRQFELSDKVDQSRIMAELKHGVLTLTLPRAEVTRPKKIEVSVNCAP
jgi:HSP20 family protein